MGSQLIEFPLNPAKVVAGIQGTDGAPAGGQDTALNVVVIAAGFTATAELLHKAAYLANDLHARIRLLVPQVVPYALPIEHPSVPAAFNERRYAEVAASQPVPTNVEIILCREFDLAIEESLSSKSVVVMAAGTPWWPTRWWPARWLPTKQLRLAHRLGELGHEVFLVEMKPSND